MGNILSYQLLPQLLNMTLTASFVILFVLLVRLALQKAPKVWAYALWGVVLFRLLCPVSFSSPLSLLGAVDAPRATEAHRVEYISPTIVHDRYPAVELPGTALEEAINQTLPGGEEQTRADPLEAPMALATFGWLTGAAALLLGSLLSLWRLRRKLSASLPLGNNVCMADGIETAFVIGLLRPKIYLPSTLAPQEREYVILHERHHIRRLDHLWKCLGFLALCLHWFNPLVWLAWVLGQRDMEMSCDEAVLHQLGGGIRADYSETLLRLAALRSRLPLVSLAFGEGDTSRRIKHALKWQTPPVWVRVIAALLCGGVIALCAANPRGSSDDLPTPFGHTYRVEQVMLGPSVDDLAEGLMTLSIDYGLFIREGDDDWYQLRAFEETDRFDGVFLSPMPSPGGDIVDQSYELETLFTKAKRLWRLDVRESNSGIVYYLAQCGSEDLYLASGRYQAGTSPTGSSVSIDRAFRLTEAEDISASVQSGDVTHELGNIGWFSSALPVDDYGALQVAEVLGQGEIRLTSATEREKLVVEEHYYEKISKNATQIQKTLHTLTPDEYGVFRLPVTRRSNEDERAVYYVAAEDGRYVFGVNFPFRSDPTYITKEFVEETFHLNYPEAVILDSVVAFDGADCIWGVVLYEDDPNVLEAAYVLEGGFCHPVSLGSEDSPAAAAAKPELTYQGKGKVTFRMVSQGSEHLHSLTMERSLQETNFISED